MVIDGVVVRDDVGVRVGCTELVDVRVGRIVCVPRADVVGDLVSFVVAVGDLEIGDVLVAVAVEEGERVLVVVREDDVVAVVVRDVVVLFVTIALTVVVRVTAPVRVLVRVGNILFVAIEDVVESFVGLLVRVANEERVPVRVADDVHVGSTRIMASSL